MRKLNTIALGVLVAVSLLGGCGQQKKNQVDQTATTAASNSLLERLTVVIKGHEYQYDVVTGASREAKSDTLPPMDYEKKLKQMFWSGKPALGFVKGDYYHTDTLFGGYTALITIVKDSGKLAMVELDEVAPPDYYAPEWAGHPKRLSGYAFFQAQSQRTHKTLVTLVNGFSLLEHQMVSENRLTGEFKTVKGASNSIRKGFLPAIARLAPRTSQASGYYYYGLTKELGGGLSGRVQVIEKDGKLVKVQYDEYFEDTKELIADKGLQQFYRQSKCQSVSYPQVTGDNFKAFANQIQTGVVTSQNLLRLPREVETSRKFKKELRNYKSIARELMSKME